MRGGSGGDLFHHLVQRVKATNSGFREGEARTLLAEVVLALEHLHAQGFVHRDVKVGQRAGELRSRDVGCAHVGVGAWQSTPC